MNVSFTQPFRRILASFSIFTLLMVPSLSLRAQTTLAQGDLSVIGFNSSSLRGISFVTWVNLSANTEIRFTDNGFNSASASTAANNVRWSEQVVIWTATAPVTAGTIITIQDETTNIGTVNIIQSSGAETTIWSLSSSSGDQVFAYQGANMPATTTPATGIQTFNNTILFGLGFDGIFGTFTNWNSTGPTNSSNSYLPSDLVSPNNIFFGNFTTNAQYNGAKTGLTASAYKTAIANIANWTVAMSGAQTFNTTVFSLGTPPSVTAHPSNSTICAGNNTGFSITAGNATSYQWQVNMGAGFTNISNGGVYSNATTTTLNITGATAGMNGYQYRCVVTGVISPNATSNNANLTVNSAPSITGQPSSASVCAGSNRIFSITANNATGYQWQVDNGGGYTSVTNGGVYSGATTNTLTITGATAGMNGYAYRCVTTGSCTPNANSNGVLLTVNAAPAITGQPSGSSVCSGNNTSFSVSASNATGYQWQVDNGGGYTSVANGGVYSGATTATLTITGTTAGMNGYAYRCIATGSCTPNATSNGILLTVSTAGQWLGTINTHWSNTGNWSCGILPTASTNVAINAGGNQPVVDITTAICNNIAIGSGASLTINANNAIEIKGAVTNSGTFAISGKAQFSGIAQTIPAGTYADLEINGTGTKTLAGSVNVNGVLTLTNSFVQLDANDISIGSAGSITDASASSFIITNSSGALKQASIGAGGRTGAILFPVGVSASSYTPASLNNTSGTSDEFSVRVISGISDAYDINDVPTGSTQTSFNVNRTWLVSESIAGGSNATLSFQWTLLDEQPGFVRSSCFASHYTGGMWQRGPTSQAATGTDPYALSLSGITSFSPFGVGSPGSTLPVNLLSFSGKPVPGGALLEWKTDNEINASHFDIQRSTDGSNYILVGNISAANTPGTHEYSFTDPVQFSKTTYYRLKQVDIDGRFIYSTVVVFAAQQKRDAVSVYPNPFVSQANLTVQLSHAGKTNFSLMDNNGKMVRKWQQDLPAGTTAMIINLEGLPAGLYHLELKDLNNSQQRIKLIKQ
ncbi:MAG: T9SS type A sorting domain-containing protein [Chitinophagaceae bacterium]